MSVKRSKKPKRQRPKVWTAHRYQLRAIAKGLTHTFLAYFLDPGLGKTTIILQLFKILQRAGLVKSMLVVAPLRPCYLVWPKEVKKWANFQHLSVKVLHSEWKGSIDFKEHHDIYVVNPEGLPKIKALLKGRREWPFDMLVIDESTKFKNMSTQRFKNLKYIIPKMKRRYILTGTPIPNGLINIQGQMAIVDMGDTFGMKLGAFRETYFKQVGRPEWKQFEPRSNDHIENLYRRAAKYCVRMKGSDYLELPERLNNFIWVDLPKKAKKHYEEVEQEMFTQIDQDEIHAETAAAVAIKCHQIANGKVYEDIDPLLPKPKIRKVIQVHSAKIDALEDLIEELDNKPVLIAYRFKHDLEALQKKFKKDLVNIGAGVSMKDCQKIEKDWNKGKIKMLAAYPGTSALGLNLQECGQDVIWFSMIDDLEAYDQFIKRIERQGSQHKHIRNHLIMARGTIDEVKYNSLTKKDHNQLKFLDRVKYYGRNKS